MKFDLSKYVPKYTNILPVELRGVIKGKNTGIRRTKPEGHVSNVVFAKEDKRFQDACEETNVKPTRRQASKFRNKKGSAYRVLYPSSVV